VGKKESLSDAVKTAALSIKTYSIEDQELFSRGLPPDPERRVRRLARVAEDPYTMRTSLPLEGRMPKPGSHLYLDGFVFEMV